MSLFASHYLLIEIESWLLFLFTIICLLLSISIGIKFANYCTTKNSDVYDERHQTYIINVHFLNEHCTRLVFAPNAAPSSCDDGK